VLRRREAGGRFEARERGKLVAGQFLDRGKETRNLKPFEGQTGRPRQRFVNSTNALDDCAQRQLTTEKRERKQRVGAIVLIGLVGNIELVKRLLQLVDLPQHFTAAQCDPREKDVRAGPIVRVLRLELR